MNFDRAGECPGSLDVTGSRDDHSAYLGGSSLNDWENPRCQSAKKVRTQVRGQK